ncbi:MAG: S-layer homology domain-containing protein [Clostridia bacterium]|nr:S-layer homology domain-containing protein [Clostridia bacterium]
MKKILIFILCFMLVGITSFAAIRFSDVADSYWGAEVIYKLANAGVINGYDDGTYKPLKSVTYGEFIKLVMANFLPADFEGEGVDTDFEHWAAPYVKLAEIYGIIEEDTITLDNINKYISRIEMSNMISMADMILNGNDFDNSKELIFTDIFSVVGKDRTLLQHAYSRGLILGNPNGTFRPNAEMNRAEAATIIDRLSN